MLFLIGGGELAGNMWRVPDISLIKLSLVGKVFYILRIGLIGLVTAGCTEPPNLPPLSSDAVILAFGNSLTYGSGATKGHDYPAILEQYTSLEVINAGVPGETTANGVNRLRPLLDRHTPELLILIHGGNDMLRKLDDDSTRSNLASMIRMAKERKISVVMLGVPKPGLILRNAKFYKELAQEWAIPIDESILPEVLSTNRLKSDQIHPNDQGYGRMAEAIHQLLQARGAL